MSVAAPPRHICDQCGRLAPRVARTAEGGLCRTCYQRDPRRFEECAHCGRNKVPSSRTPDGKALCNNCARPKRVCAGCGRLDHAKVVTGDGPLCQRCYTAPPRQCGKCGTVGPVAIRAGRRSDVDLCKRCFESPELACGQCGQTRPAHTHWPLGPVCLPCYKRTLRRAQQCTRCSEPKILIGRDTTTGARICGPCAGSAQDYSCTECGHAGPQHFAGTCLRCSVERLVSELLTTETGAVVEGLQELPTLLARRGDPASTMRWLIKPRTQLMLSTIARSAATDTLTHSTLDTCDQIRARHYLRAMLVELGLLPPRDEPIDRFETWINELAATLPAAHAALIHPYARWAVLRAARRRARRRGYTHGAANTDRERIRTALRLIEHIESQGHQIRDLSQAMLDSWTGGNRDRTSHIAGFVVWLTHRGIVEDVAVHRISTPPPSEIGDEQEHLTRITEMLDDTSHIELSTRVAALLVLLYGSRLPQIQRLTTADVTTTKKGTALTLAGHPLLLPAKVGALIDQLSAEAAANPHAQTLDRSAANLFPGGRPHEPIHTTTLGRKLNKAGISVRVNRNRAMLALTSDLPAAIVATQFGLHISSVTTWAKFAQRDQRAYLAARPQSAQPLAVGGA